MLVTFLSMPGARPKSERGGASPEVDAPRRLKMPRFLPYAHGDCGNQGSIGHPADPRIGHQDLVCHLCTQAST